MKNRRAFIKTSAVTAAGVGLLGSAAAGSSAGGKRIGIIGLDTSHSIAFTREFNAEDPDPALGGYRVVAAYRYGSREIESSYSRIDGYTEEIRKWGVTIVDSIHELLNRVDAVLLETNDGRLHLEQALPVIDAQKPLFIDKPMAASLRDAVAIFEAAEKKRVPVFSSSSLRYMEPLQAVSRGEQGEVFGAYAWSPAIIESTHPDLFWYGIHGVETLFTAMGRGCKSVTRFFTDGTDVVVGVWNDEKIGSFRGIRDGRREYGGIAFTSQGQVNLGPYSGYKPQLLEIARFFDTGISRIDPLETLEIMAFMEAADRSKAAGGVSVKMDQI